jgi:hypothetical protein
MLKSLKLFLVKPISPMVRINTQEFISIQTDVVAENVNNCFVNFKYDVNHLHLIEGSELISLGSGSFSKQLFWMLKAIKISHNSLWTEITAEAESIFQAVGFRIKVIKNKEAVL